MNIRYWLFPLLVASFGIAGANDFDHFEDLFKQQFKKEVLPELRLAMVDRYKAKGMSSTQIEQELKKIANKAAICQFKTFQAHSTHYQEIVFQSLLDGDSTEDAAFQLNQALENDISKGEISQKEVSRRIKEGMRLYSECVVKSNLIDKL